MNIRAFKNYFLFLSALTFYSCISPAGQQQCLNNYLSEIKNSPDYNKIRSAAKDSVTYWATLNIENFYGINSTKWEIDSAVFFNEDKSKALLLLLEIDTVSTAKLDYINLIAAEKKGADWHFYTEGMHLIYLDRERNKNGRPFTFKELSERGRYQLIRGGYYEKRSCNVNYDYINDWFNEPLSDYHRHFLNNRIQKSTN